MQDVRCEPPFKGIDCETQNSLLLQQRLWHWLASPKPCGILAKRWYRWEEYSHGFLIPFPLPPGRGVGELRSVVLEWTRYHCAFLFCPKSDLSWPLIGSTQCGCNVEFQLWLY